MESKENDEITENIREDIKETENVQCEEENQMENIDNNNESDDDLE